MYAIVKTGGKQYRAEAGRTLRIDRLSAEEGSVVELGEVLMIAEDGQVTVGTPVIDGARVMAHVEAHGKAGKIVVYKYKNKVRTRKKQGHRQRFTQLTVEQILRPGEEAKVIERKPKAVATPVPDDGNLDSQDEAIEAIAELGAEGAIEEAAPEVAAPERATPRARRGAAKAAAVTTEPAEAIDTPVPDDGDLDTEDEAAEAIVEMGAKQAARTTEKKSAKPPAPKSKAAKEPKPKAEKKPAKAEKAAKAATDDKPKTPRRRLPLGRKKKED
jgi:large subunit ribosomal protein L21